MSGSTLTSKNAMKQLRGGDVDYNYPWNAATDRHNPCIVFVE
jgi:hypothetical protein